MGVCGFCGATDCLTTVTANSVDGSVTEFGNGLNLFVITIFASDGFGACLGASCGLGDCFFEFVLANIVAAFGSGGVNNFNGAKSCLLRLGILEFKSGSIDADDSNNFFIYYDCVTRIL